MNNNTLKPTIIEFRLIGNITPASWDKKIISKTGKALRTAIRLCSEVVSWYVPKKITNSRKKQYVRKFSGDVWRTSYQYLATKLNLSNESVRRSFVALEERGFIKREFRTIVSKKYVLTNVLFIRLGDNINELLDDKNSDFSDDNKIKYKQHKNYGGYPQQCGQHIYNNKDIKNRSTELNLNKNNFEKKSIEETANPTPTENNLPKSINTKPTKTLLSFYPLNEEHAKQLELLSQRNFNLSGINELLKEYARKFPNIKFIYKAGFIKFMTSMLKREKRLEHIVNQENFKIKVKNYETDKIEKYLQEIESNPETNSEMQLKKRLASALPSQIAYELLKNTISINIIKNNNLLTMSLRKSITISPIQKNIILNQAKSIFQEINLLESKITSIENIEFKIPEDKPIITHINNKNDNTEQTSNNLEDAEIIEPRWHKVCLDLKDFYGKDVFKSWFSKLTPDIDENNKLIKLLGTTKFISSWISNNYSTLINSIIYQHFGKYNIVYC